MPKNSFRVMSCRQTSSATASDDNQTGVGAPAHLVFVAGGEERHVQQQTLAAVPQVVAVLGGQVGRQRVRAHADVPQVVVGSAVQREADPGLGTDGVKDGRSCRRESSVHVYVH